jgi:DNA-binding FrmR family transcriptional regulator
MDTLSTRSHPEIVKRLRRVKGHLAQHHRHDRNAAAVPRRRPAIARGREKAIAQAKKTLIHDHIGNCLEQTVGPLAHEHRGPVEEFKAITKDL